MSLHISISKFVYLSELVPVLFPSKWNKFGQSYANNFCNYTHKFLLDWTLNGEELSEARNEAKSAWMRKKLAKKTYKILQENEKQTRKKAEKTTRQYWHKINWNIFKFCCEGFHFFAARVFWGFRFVCDGKMERNFGFLKNDELDAFVQIYKGNEGFWVFSQICFRL